MGQICTRAVPEGAEEGPGPTAEELINSEDEAVSNKTSIDTESTNNNSKRQLIKDNSHNYSDIEEENRANQANQKSHTNQTTLPNQTPTTTITVTATATVTATTIIMAQSQDGATSTLLEGVGESRFEIYKPKMIEFLEEGGSSGINLVKIKAVLPDNSEEKDEFIEKIVATYTEGNGENSDNNDNNNNSNKTQSEKEIELSCGICMDDEFTPSQLIEYTFDDKQWYLANMCMDCLEMYKQNKFENWKEKIENPDCEAAFRRMLKIGVITHMFDKEIFPSPEHEQHLYEVKDHHGKTFTIPRPVARLRIWDASERKYNEVDSHLAGAPKTEEEIQTFWNEMIEKFYMQHGKETVIEWLNAASDNNTNES